MRELGNEEMRIMSEILIINFAKGASRTGKTLAKCVPLKVTYLSYRKKTEIFRRRLRAFLVKKGCKEGGVSL